MTDSVYTPLVNDPHADVISAQLGTTNSQFSDKDVGQAVKMGLVSNYVQCSDGDEIGGVVVAVAPHTVNDGKSFGSVQRNKRIKAAVAANQGGTAMAVLDLVVCGTPLALGTAGLTQVKTGTDASQLGADPFTYTERSPNTELWRVIRIMTGTGVAGDHVLIERVTA
jgi:hypothetical protein